MTSKGDLIYSRERDEPEPAQLVKREVAEKMNQMLERVVTEGTGGQAALDFTNVAGKTGTSTGPNDVWFVGFTGKYVGVVWLGNDDNRPMSSGNTGGHMAAPLWHSIMAVAHTDMNIPTIPGLAPHPVQIAEQQRLAWLRANNPVLAAEMDGAADASQHSASLMPEPTKETLKRLATALRKAAGIAEPASAPAPAAPGSDGTKPPKPERKADRAPGPENGAAARISTSSAPQASGGVQRRLVP